MKLPPVVNLHCIRLPWDWPYIEELAMRGGYTDGSTGQPCRTLPAPGLDIIYRDAWETGRTANLQPDKPLIT